MKSAILLIMTLGSVAAQGGTVIIDHRNHTADYTPHDKPKKMEAKIFQFDNEKEPTPDPFEYFMTAVRGNKLTRHGKILNFTQSIGNVLNIDYQMSAFAGISSGDFPFYSRDVYQAGI